METKVEELVNIANYCNTILVRFGKTVDECAAKYHSDDDAIEFHIRYKEKGEKKTFQYQIQSCNFIITDVEVLVNRNTIDTLNEEIVKRVNL